MLQSGCIITDLVGEKLFPHRVAIDKDIIELVNASKEISEAHYSKWLAK